MSLNADAGDKNCSRGGILVREAPTRWQQWALHAVYSMPGSVICMGVLTQRQSTPCRRDSRSLSEPRSERKKGLHTSLTELTEQALGQGWAARASQANGSSLQHGSPSLNSSSRAVQQASAA